jgi:hypothetical protein
MKQPLKRAVEYCWDHEDDDAGDAVSEMRLKLEAATAALSEIVDGYESPETDDAQYADFAKFTAARALKRIGE